MPSLPRRHRPAPGPPLQQATRFLSRELDLHYEYASVSRIVMRAARLAGINPATAHPNKANTSQAPSASDAIVSGNAASKRNTPTNTPRSDDSSAPTAIAPAQLSRPINSPSNITTRLMRLGVAPNVCITPNSRARSATLVLIADASVKTPTPP